MPRLLKVLQMLAAIRISHEPDEHLARKERVAKDSEDHGFHADIESQTADGHARLDVRINGANGIVLATSLS